MRVRIEIFAFIAGTRDFFSVAACLGALSIGWVVEKERSREREATTLRRLSVFFFCLFWLPFAVLAVLFRAVIPALNLGAVSPYVFCCFTSKPFTSRSLSALSVWVTYAAGFCILVFRCTESVLKMDGERSVLPLKGCLLPTAVFCVCIFVRPLLVKLVLVMAACTW